jgi:ribosomal protein L4
VVELSHLSKKVLVELVKVLTVSSLMVGGGTFGPTPRDYDSKVNKKMIKKALQSVIADKLQAGKLTCC